MKFKCVKPLAFVLFLGFSANGYSQAWNNTSSGAWGVAVNWTPAIVPNSATSDVTLSSGILTSAPTITLAGAFLIRNMSITTPGFQYTLSGGALVATPTAGNGITITGTNAHSISSDLNYLAAYTITQGSTMPLTISGAISGSLGFSKAGTGELIFSGATPNSFTGLLTISAGQVTFSKSAGVIACGNGVTLSGAGAKLQLNASEQTSNASSFTISNATAVLDLNGQSTTIGSLSITTTGTYALNGTLNLAGIAATTLQSPTAATSPTITGTVNLIGTTGGVSKPGAGTFSLQNVGIQNGTHDFTSTTGTIDISGVVSGNGSLNKIGTGTLNFSGSSINTFTGMTSVTAGTMTLSRATPGVCIAGDVSVAGGTLTLNSATNFSQIAATSNMTISAGTFNMNAFGATLNSLTMPGGTLTNNTGPGLTLLSTGTALTMRNTTIPGQIYLMGASGGDVVFDAANNGTATLTNVDLGSVIRTFNIGAGVVNPDMTVSGVISGSGGIIKTGDGTLSFTSTGSNSYTGMTTVSAGALLLGKTAPFTAISGNLLINGGTVQQTVLNQLAMTSNLQMDSGTFGLNGLASTIGSFTFNGGTFTQGIGQLSLASTGTALTMRNTIVNGTVNLTGASGGSVVFDSSNGGMALINSINLNGVSRVFNIAAGSDSSVKMILQGSTGAGGALIKDGAGILELIGTHTYTLATTQVLDGTLTVNGILTCPAMTVSSGALIKGAGTITSNGIFNGLIQPGNSIGTLNLVGAQTFGSTFVLENEFNQTATDLVNITGSLTIDTGATVSLIPLVNSFTTPLSHTIIQTTAGITGTFQVINPLPFYSASLIYNANSIVLQIIQAPFSNFNLTGNAAVVANYLDQLSIPAGSDLANVITAIRQLSTTSEVQNAFLQMQPSQLKGLALSQENNAFQLESYILQRTRKIGCWCPDPALQSNLWAVVGGDFYTQNRIGQEIPFQTNSQDVIFGYDTKFNSDVLFGMAGAYTHSSITWQSSRGSGNMNSGTLATYLNFSRNHFFVTGLLLGAYNAYNESRHIRFSTIDRHAKGNVDGCQFVGNLVLGGNIQVRKVNCLPYVSGQFMYTQLGSFREKGADSLNLNIFSSYYTLFRGQGGFDLSYCACLDNQKVDLSAGLSYIREQRFSGRNFTAALSGYSSTFTVTGLNPDRNAFSPKASLSFISNKGNASVTIGYDAEIGNRYFDQNAFIQGRCAF